jgi:hypothetical protein
VGYNLLRAGVDATPPLVELVNSQGLSAMHYWEEALETFDRTPVTTLLVLVWKSFFSTYY